jgi:serine/threonine-protein kinase
MSVPGQVMGSLDYLAPELIRGEPATPLSDIYALGCVVFECLSGEPPFAAAGGGMLQTGMAILGREPPDPCAHRPDAPPTLSRAVLKALAKESAHRPPTAIAYVHALRTAAELGPG